MKAPQQALRSVVASLAKRVSLRWYWKLRARDIDARWGKDTADHALIARMIDAAHARSVLYIGCGTGRLFPVYLNTGVQEVLGQDVSRWALREARRRFPQAIFHFTHEALTKLESAPGPFDLCVSNRVLSAVPPQEISRTLRKLASVAKHLYLNEYSTSDGGQSSNYWFMHDYLALLRRHAEHTCLEQGRLANATYYLVRIDSLKPIVSEPGGMDFR